MKSALGLCPSIAATLVLSAVAAAQGAPLYDLESLGPPPAFVNGVGPAGHVVGTRLVSVFPNLLERAVVFPPGQGAIELPVPAGHARSVARGVDASGLVVGAVAPLQPGMTASVPALWRPQVGGGYTVELLALPAGLTIGSANAINGLGDIVGEGYVAFPGLAVGVHFATTGPGTSLGALGLAGLVVVNDERLALDNATPARFVDLDTLATGTTPLPPPQNGVPFIGATARALTDNGRIAGTATLFTLGTCRTHAVTLRPGVGWEVSASCGQANVATDVNEGGDRLELLGGVLHLVLDGQAPVPLDGLIDGPVGTGPWDTDQSTAFVDEERRIVCSARDLSTGVNHLVRLTPRVTCQADLGFGGPGDARLVACGGDLSLGTTAELALVGAPAAAPVYLGVAFTQNPTPFLGGIAVPYPPALVVPLSTDGAGVLRFGPLVGGIGPLTLYVQALFPDASSPTFVGISNALRIEFLP